MSQPIIKIKPVGGVGQIGSNMTFLEHNGVRILIDAGILFPYEDFFDIDYLIPDLTKVETPDYLLITHGHEDHIGAIFNIIQAFPNIKIVAPKFAAALIRKKLEFNKRPYPVEVINYNSSLKFNGFSVDYIQVNHSIPDTYGLYFSFDIHHTGIFFVSDFKIDHKTKYEPFFDFAKLKQLSEKHTTKVLLADSTNITSNTHNTPSEFDLIDSFESIFQNLNHRAFVTMFSSNIHRIHTILFLAEKYQFKVVPYGRSMISYINTAIEEGFLPAFEKTLQSADSTKNNQENVIVLLSGCQGDFLGTFRRVSLGEDSLFKVRSTDTFILSSKAIPGNEKKINLLMNKISSFGAKLISPSDMLIHVSGHPGKNDLLNLYQEFMPTDIIPIHGEVHFIREHISFIKSTFPLACPHFVLNFDEVHFNSEMKIQIVEGEKHDPVIFHGNHIVLEKEKISERRKMACNGSIFLSVKLDHLSKYKSHLIHLLGIPKIITENRQHFDEFLFNELQKINFKDHEKSSEELKISIRRYFDSKLGYKPTTVVHIQ